MLRYPKTVLAFALIGTLFAGSVTIRQFVSPASEPGLFSCVGLSLWGLSPCPYGLACFVLVLIFSILLLRKHSGSTTFLVLLRLSALAGVLFSGWVVWRELCLPALALGASYWETFSVARVPACAWGFFVFVTTFLFTLPKQTLTNTNQPFTSTLT